MIIWNKEKFSRAATAAFTGHRFVDAQREHVKAGFQMQC